MSDRQPTCEERVASRLEDRIEILRDLWNMDDHDAYHEEHETNMYEFGLSFDYVAPETFNDQDEAYWRYQLSWGGPSDEFRVYGEQLDEWNVHVYRIEYAYLDWFDGATRTLYGDDRALLDEIFSCFFVDSGTAAHVRDQALELA